MISFIYKSTAPNSVNPDRTLLVASSLFAATDAQLLELAESALAILGPAVLGLSEDAPSSLVRVEVSWEAQRTITPEESP